MSRQTEFHRYHLLKYYTHFKSELHRKELNLQLRGMNPLCCLYTTVRLNKVVRGIRTHHAAFYNGGVLPLTLVHDAEDRDSS